VLEKVSSRKSVAVASLLAMTPGSVGSFSSEPLCPRATAGGRALTTRSGVGPEFRWWLEDAQVLLGFLGDSCLQSLRPSEECGQALVAGGLGIEGVTVARVSGV
jgi:hypothetical protein